ncbi:MAG: AAA family ATPase [Pseudomonadota bacterium]
MTDTADGQIQPLGNVARFMELLSAVEDISDALPQMAAFYGPAGYGKSWAANYANLTADVCLVQCRSYWTKKKLVETIAEELGTRTKGTIPDIVGGIVERLMRAPRTLLIDEADYLVKAGMIELVRDIYEASLCPVILIGEELLPDKLKQWERVHSRMLRWEAAQPVSARDLDMLRALWCPEILVDDTLVERLAKESRGSTRRVCINFQRISAFAQLNGLSTVTEADWGDEPFYTGETPEPRENLA